MMARKNGFLSLGPAIIAAAVGAALNAAAASYTNSATGNWDADASWTGVRPAAGGAADAEVVLNGAGAIASTNNLSGAFLLNRLTFAAGAATLSGNALAFTNSGAAGPQIVNAADGLIAVRDALVLGSDTAVDSGSGSITNYGAVSGKGGLIKAGGGTLVFATNSLGALTYSGSTLVSAGTMIVGTMSGLASIGSTNFTVTGGATLRVLSAFGVNAWAAPDKASVNVQSNATLMTDVPTISCGTLAAASGATISGSSGCLSLHATDTVAAAVANLGSLSMKRIILEPYGAANPRQTLRFDGTGAGLVIGTDSGTAFSLRPGTASGVIAYRFDIADSPAADIDLLVPFLNFRPGAAASALIKQGSGSMQVNGLDWAAAANPTKPFNCTVSGGTLIWNVSAANAVGVNVASLMIDAGAGVQLGTNGTVGALYVAVTNNGTLTFNRSDAYTFTNAVVGSGVVVQKGSGTLTLTGASSHSGGTTVSAGILLVGAAGVLGGGTVAVGAGALGGSGTISAPVELSAAGLLLPGGSNTVGTLTLSNAGASALTLSGGALLCDLSTVSGVCDSVAVGGELVLNGANTIRLAFPGGTPPAGTYTLMSYASKSGAGTLKLDAYYPNATLAVTDTAATLTVTGSGITYLKWAGGVSGAWDLTTANWLRNGVSSVYADGDPVLFDDSAAGNFAVGAAAPVTPASVTFNNSASNYSVSASIGGAATPLIKFGSGVATLSGANSYGGGTVLAAGTLAVSSSANLPAGALTFNGGTLQILGTSLNSLAPYAVNWDSFKGGLDLAAGNTVAVTNVIAGSGGLTKSGAGALALSGTNTYSGGTTVSAGYVRISNASGVGSGPVNMTGNNCELDLMGGVNATNAITVRGVGVVNSAGSLQSFSGTSNTWSGPVTLGDGNARLGAPNAVLVVQGVIGSGANPYDLIIRNPNDVGGTIVLASTNAYRGSTWIRCGTIRLGVDNALPPAALLHLGLEAGQTSVTNATFDLAGFNQQIAGIVDRSTDNVHVVTCSSPSFSTLTVNNASTAYTFAGTLAGNLSLVKAGAGALTLAGTNTLSGGVTVGGGALALGTNATLGVNCTNIVVSAGTLALSNSLCVSDAATLQIANGGGAKVNVGAGVEESVGYLFFGAKQKMAGTYGAPGSGAGVIDSEHFAGSGVVRVLHGNSGLVLRLQ